MKELSKFWANFFKYPFGCTSVIDQDYILMNATQTDKTM